MTTRPETAGLPLPRREPAVLLAGAQAIFAAALTLASLWVSVPDVLQAAILATTGALAAAVTGWRVAPRRPALVAAVVQAAAPLVVILGLPLPPGGDAVVLGVAATVAGLLLRGSVSPAEVGPPPSG
ncbi:hypothetical protein MXD61_11340 [Frankia sp. AgPm24]|uniref:hypothetical protein n=1 Tax=Frankia sp. AgPm24 TaxID=631128 RepID=UPI00200E5DCE|nr:hypothetical protein [Frankia sp. AgPm24]MCK9922466.1 hypothetical protein [Frankia sp. AgPm24]